MKKYLLLIEEEKLWEKFKEVIDKDINTEIIELIKKKINSGGKKSEK
jgi:anti-sigma28 factor (negative regulator of flagellin synthesis)